MGEKRSWHGFGSFVYGRSRVRERFMSRILDLRPMQPKLTKSGPKKRKRINSVSAKQSKRLKEYARLRKTFLEEHPRCEYEETGCSLLAGFVAFPVPCTRAAVDVHHMKRRGPYLNDTSTWLAVCRFHHTFLHDNVADSKMKGYL